MASSPWVMLPLQQALEEQQLNLPESRREVVLDALEKLEFRKSFLIFNYIGSRNVEDVVSADQILSYQRLSMTEFEDKIWNDFGKNNCQEKDRVINVNWENGERYNYHCHVDVEGNLRFKGPYPEKAATLLQKTLGDDNVLKVKLMEEQSDNLGAESIMQSPVFNQISQGIFLGKKRYQFFAFKEKYPSSSSQVECYFVCMDPPQTVQDARSSFMHIHNNYTGVHNYMAKFSLILSKTITLDLDFNDLHVEVIEDIPCQDENGELIYGKDDKPLILTKGTGFISEDLALRCPCISSDEGNLQDMHETLKASLFPDKFPLPVYPPLLIQFRMFYHGQATKGTLLVNKKLPPNTIQVRPSMVMVESDESLSGAPTVNSFEVVATSNKPKNAVLSKNLIALLNYGGVPKNFFLALLWEALTKPMSVLHNIQSAVKAAVNRDFSDEFNAARMILSGIPLDEPYLQHRLSEIAKDEMKSLKEGKLPVSDSFYLMGTADPTGTLNNGEVCIIMDQGQLSGPVLVYRNPGIHPGDVHVVNARYVEELKEFVGNAKYGIFFPSKGKRSMADEIAGGDYDGDMYWVSTNNELLEYFKPTEPWIRDIHPNVRNTSLPSAEKLELELFRLYRATRLHPNMEVGKAASWWLVYMDQLLTLGDDCEDEKHFLMRKIDQLIDLFYDALNAPKNGLKVVVPNQLRPDKYPHHMGRDEHCSYKSKSVLGEIHDIVDQLCAPIKFWKLKCFEAYIPELYTMLWGNHYDQFRFEMQEALNKSTNVDLVYQKYRKELYGGIDDAYDLDTTEKAWAEIRLEALAIYHVCYDYAMLEDGPTMCDFAWKVAGDALLKIYLMSTGEKPMLCAPSIGRQMMR